MINVLCLVGIYILCLVLIYILCLVWINQPFLVLYLIWFFDKSTFLVLISAFFFFFFWFWLTSFNNVSISKHFRVLVSLWELFYLQGVSHFFYIQGVSPFLSTRSEFLLLSTISRKYFIWSLLGDCWHDDRTGGEGRNTHAAFVYSQGSFAIVDRSWQSCCVSLSGREKTPRRKKERQTERETRRGSFPSLNRTTDTLTRTNRSDSLVSKKNKNKSQW